MKKYSLEIAVFMGGAIVMVYELVGSRILAPYVGTSTFVWTSLIGVILASLSLGYWLGGKLADEEPNLSNFSWLLFFSSVLIFLTWMFKETILDMTSIIVDNRWRALISAIILFVPASFFLGMLSPYAVRLKLDNIKVSGKTVGNLYALSTLGSIVGTFLAGFLLIPTLGTNQILLLLALLLSLTALLVYRGRTWWLKLSLALLLLILLIFGVNPTVVQAANFVDLDTQYSRVWIYDMERDGQMARVLMKDDKPQSAMYLESNELVFFYAKFYNLAEYFVPDMKQALMIGGAAYSYPKYFLQNYPGVNLDVVEIDPKLTQLAYKYFALEDHDDLKIIHDDGRIFLNNNQKKYDVIFGDAFASYYSVPHHLTTIEAVERIYDSLTDNGVTIINVISAIEGKTSDFFQAEYTTFNQLFERVYAFPVNYPENPARVQNIMLVAVKGDKSFDFNSLDPEIQGMLDHLYLNPVINDALILTDNFAPVEYYINKIQ